MKTRVLLHTELLPVLQYLPLFETSCSELRDLSRRNAAFVVLLLLERK